MEKLGYLLNVAQMRMSNKSFLDYTNTMVLQRKLDNLLYELEVVEPINKRNKCKKLKKKEH
jgi:hypothetical protein